MATMKQAANEAKHRLMAAARWLYLNATDTGRALDAYMKGEAEFELRLRVDDDRYQTKVAAIEDIGWRLDDRIDLPPVEVEAQTMQDDGTFETAVTTTQEADFYFVRDDDEDA